jgi:hypothetical protein
MSQEALSTSMLGTGIGKSEVRENHATHLTGGVLTLINRIFLVQGVVNSYCALLQAFNR